MNDALPINPALASRGELTRERILDAAEQIFANKDFSAARLEDVAQAVGIKRASIVYYFSNKQELYDAVEGRLFAAMVEATEQRLNADAPALQQVLTVLDTWLDFMVKRPTAPRLILRDSANTYPNASASVRISGVALSTWESVIRAGQEKGELVDVEPMYLLHLLGAPAIYFAATSQLLGENRNFDPAEPEHLQAFRSMLHRSARAVLQP
ncbi:TetR/AcrR family transcriptional regulator [Aestuariicella hydrocarbonica]|uniref:TetR/AcrR family transcriptional regulator n=1 Tax=Pseudomaricurvus hydrocarbonicus TaxID=1470433 RepID=A0A9E5JSR6_9GAMM|nr:TetR/AcrR family transcriptional regulator [Aestuariicella hydrocarbonica]NHO66108.1 TetR/AcrR family transcriptional regulator [Aestuariicella hydrocarbonica]